MKFVNWLIRVVLFLLLFGLALKNTGDVTLSLFFGYVWRAPLILLLLVFFALGALLGMMTVLPLQWRKRRSAPAGRQSSRPGLGEASASRIESR